MRTALAGQWLQIDRVRAVGVTIRSVARRHRSRGLPASAPSKSEEPSAKKPEPTVEETVDYLRELLKRAGMKHVSDDHDQHTDETCELVG